MSKSEGPAKAGIKIISEHRRAKFDFDLDETLEAGLSLMGSEVKALRNGEANLNDAYGSPERDELYLCNAHIGAYKPAAMFAHLPTRKRKLLLHREEIDKWAAKVRERGYSIVPLMLYFKNGRVKVKLGLGRGKKKGDRRATIKERESKREMDRAKGF
ncbi:MAG: SsrA-binding protein SmpB [Archangiaceae bacterium]|nr:SsrA-binding protein SmpB [Archangiaceae bacterium]